MKGWCLVVVVWWLCGDLIGFLVGFWDGCVKMCVVFIESIYKVIFLGY